jgi:uncharacterized membrane protein
MSARTSRLLLAGVFVFAGMMHFVIPASYVGIVPPWLPWHRGLVYLSGALEIAGGIGLLISRTRRAAGIGLVLLLIAVWPANLQMVLAARAADEPLWYETLLWLRLPLQLVLIWWVWRASRSSEGETSRGERGAG